ncbi:hypothetical protein ACLK1U_03950 [Escherichia coli]
MYVETPALHRLPEKKRRAILSALRLAQELARRRRHFPIQRKKKQ